MASKQEHSLTMDVLLKVKNISVGCQFLWEETLNVATDSQT